MSNLTDGERLMRLETLQETTLAEIKEMRREIKHMGENYVQKRTLEAEINLINKKIDKVDKRRWVQNTLSAVLGATLSLLIAYFIANMGR